MTAYQNLVQDLVKNKVPISEIKKFVIEICKFIENKVDFGQVKENDLKVQRPGLIFILLKYYSELKKGKFAFQDAIAKERNPNSNTSRITPQEILTEIDQSIEGKKDYYEIAKLIRNKQGEITRS